MSTQTLGQQVSWFRGFIQGKTRITFAWIFALLLGFSAKEFPTWPGIGMCFLGATVRFWASGYLRKDTRPAVGGPYAFVRNPLYLGTYLMALGVCWAAESWLLFLGASILFGAIYHYIILDEEIKLQELFGTSYTLYCKNVPRFFPRIWPPFAPARSQILAEINPEMDHHYFSFSLANKNKAFEAYFSFLGLIGFVTLTAYCWKLFS